MGVQCHVKISGKFYVNFTKYDNALNIALVFIMKKFHINKNEDTNKYKTENTFNL